MMNTQKTYQGVRYHSSAFFVSKLLILAVFVSTTSCAQTPPPAKEDLVIPKKSESSSDKEIREATLVFSKEDLLGKFDPSKHTDFVLIEKKYTEKPNIYMRKEAYNSWKKMHEAAAKDGINLIIISATRNFDYQKGIWERKWNDAKFKGKDDLQTALNILKYSSMPGTSRHHWGTDVDFNSVTPTYFTSGQGKKIYDWLVKNAATYGFAQTYTSKKDGRTGYEEEHWHWSYMPLSSQLLKQYNEKISYADLTGFAGSKSAEAAKAIELYVNGIPEEFKKR